MILLQILVDISQGKYDASSVKDKRQLARVASVVKECFFVADQRTYDSDHVPCDKAAAIRDLVRECLDHASILTCEYREKVIVQMDRNIEVMQLYQDQIAVSKSIVDEEREHNAVMENFTLRDGKLYHPLCLSLPIVAVFVTSCYEKFTLRYGVRYELRYG